MNQDQITSFLMELKSENSFTSMATITKEQFIIELQKLNCLENEFITVTDLSTNNFVFDLMKEAPLVNVLGFDFSEFSVAKIFEITDQDQIKMAIQIGILAYSILTKEFEHRPLGDYFRLVVSAHTKKGQTIRLSRKTFVYHIDNGDGTSKLMQFSKWEDVSNTNKRTYYEYAVISKNPKLLEITNFVLHELWLSKLGLSFSPTQYRVLELYNLGLELDEIAEHMNTTIDKVREYVKEIKRKVKKLVENIQDEKEGSYNGVFANLIAKEDLLQLGKTRKTLHFLRKIGVLKCAS